MSVVVVVVVVNVVVDLVLVTCGLDADVVIVVADLSDFVAAA